MTEDHDFSLESEHLEEVIETPPPASPVVVIEYRSRGLPGYVAIPLLILVAAGSVAVYHRVSSRTARQLATASSVTPPAAQPAPAAPLTAQVPTPLALNSQPIAASELPPIPPPGATKPAPVPEVAGPPVAAATKPEPKATESTPKDEAKSRSAPPAIAVVPTIPRPAPAQSPPPPPAPMVTASPRAPVDPTPETRPRPPLGGAIPVGFSVPSDPDNPFSDLAISRKPPMLPGEADPTPRDDEKPANTLPIANADLPLPDKTELMDEIAREAAEKKQEIRKQVDLKSRAREAVDAESLRRIEEDRVTFRRELAEILKTGGKQAGQQIDALCDRYGRNYDTAIKGRVLYVLRHSKGRVSKEARVRQFRSFGVPEPGILDYLANELHHLINTRNGPRHPDDIRVSAARQLLGIKLNRDEGGNGPALQARSGQPEPTDTAGNPGAR